MKADLRGRPMASGVARVALLEPGELTAEQAATYDRIASGKRKSQAGLVPVMDAKGRLVGPFGLMLLAPEIGDATQAVGSALRFNSKLSDSSRELAILAVAVGEGSEFEWMAHEEAALAAGLSVNQLQQLLNFEPLAGLSAIDHCVLNVVRLLLENGSLSDEEYALAVSGLSLGLLAELVWLVGYYSSLALALKVFAPPNPLLNVEATNH